MNDYLHVFNFVTAAVRRDFSATDEEIKRAVGKFLAENGDSEGGRLSRSERRCGGQLTDEESTLS